MEAFKFQIFSLALLALLLAPASVDAVCGSCTNAHACISETQFQLCFDGVRDQSQNYTCPSDRAICVDYIATCMANGTAAVRGCGDVSVCGVCPDVTAKFTCTSRNTFAACSNGAITAYTQTCKDNFVCSAPSAAAGTPCVSHCRGITGEVCDLPRQTSADDTPIQTTSLDTSPVTTESTSDDSSVTTVNPPTATTGISTVDPTTDSSTATPPTSTPTVNTPTETTPTTVNTPTKPSPSPTVNTPTETSPTPTETLPNDTTSTPTVNTPTETTPTTASPSTEPTVPAETVYCQGISTAGRYAIPGDTVCTSFINCIYREESWKGIIYNCAATKPYFNASAFTCGTTKPSGAGCTDV
ncbi:cell wall protein DAN4 isoform X2 [Drosophila guanche]|uniref:cell wall protein DAN4 isoform X2 n=1 Tax=Drosophila guanche TaxID=7266 RepID=UPI001471CEDE|nr:cell wall protein DAN4 isoform X2 [Drosophila guanche]